MKRVAVGMLLALLCGSSTGCKKGSGSIEDAGTDTSTDSGAGGSGGAGGIGGTAGVGGTAGMGGVGGSICEFTICPTGCADLDTDDENCGSCGMICDGTDVCVNGICGPDPG